MPAGVTRSRIVVGADGSAASDAAVRWAAMRALPLQLFHVVVPTWARSAQGPDRGRDHPGAARSGGPDHEQITLGSRPDRRHAPRRSRPGAIRQHHAGPRGGLEAGVDARGRQPRPCDVPARWLTEAAKHAQLVVLGSRRGASAKAHLGSVIHAVAIDLDRCGLRLPGSRGDSRRDQQSATARTWLVHLRRHPHLDRRWGDARLAVRLDPGADNGRGAFGSSSWASCRSCGRFRSARRSAADPRYPPRWWPTVPYR